MQTSSYILVPSDTHAVLSCSITDYHVHLSRILRHATGTFSIYLFQYPLAMLQCALFKLLKQTNVASWLGVRC